MQDVERWGVLTIGTGLGNARFTNRTEIAFPTMTGPYPRHARPRVRPSAGPSTSLVPGIHAFFPTTQDVDGRDIGERSDAVLRTAMPGHDGVQGGDIARAAFPDRIRKRESAREEKAREAGAVCLCEGEVARSCHRAARPARRRGAAARRRPEPDGHAQHAAVRAEAADRPQRHSRPRRHRAEERRGRDRRADPPRRGRAFRRHRQARAADRACACRTSAIPRSATAARSAARSPSPIRRPNCRPACWRSAARSRSRDPRASAR